MKKTNKLISILLVAVMLLSMAPLSLTAFAAVELTDSTTDVTLKDTDGDGFYEIGTAEQLYAFANLVNAGNATINAELTDDILLNQNVIAADGSLNGEPSEFKKWTPIGTEEVNYAGVFDGAKHTISGLFYHGDGEYAGLFGYTKGKYNSESSGFIKELGLVDSYFLVEGTQRTYRVGGLVGFAHNTSAKNCYVIANFDLTSTYYDVPFGPSVYIGGIYGMTSYVDAKNCYTVINVTVEGKSVDMNSIGGFFGNSTNEKMINCHTNYNSWGYCNDGSELTGSTIGVTKEKFQSGEIAYLLNDSMADNNSVWKQTLGEDNYPSFNGKYVDYDESRGYYNLAHMHSFEYSDDGDTITATCTAKDCYLNNADGGTLKIYAPADLYADGTAKEATIENNLVDTSVAISDITYSAPYGLPPKDAGTYTASVTVGGATATVEFTLLNYAAKVTDKDGNAVGNYKTFAEAVTAASASEDSTVTLLDDITLSETQYVSSGKFTLDLNGKTLLNETKQTIRLQSDADVTIKDSGEGGTIQTNGETAQAIYSYGTLTVEDGLFKGAAGINNGGTLNFKNGKIEAGTYSAIECSGTVYIYDGTFESSKRGVITVNTGVTAYIYGGEFSGSYGITNHGTAYIEGGEFKGNSYAALNLLGGTVEVTGGSFTGTDNEYGSFAGTPYGEFTVCYSDGATLVLKGGEFPNGFVVDISTANTFLAEGYAFYDKDGNKISVADDAKIIDGYVQVKEHFVASVTDKDGNEIGTYNTLADAITAAQGSEGSTVTLLDDCNVSDCVEITSGTFIFDLAGNSLTISGSNTALFVDGSDINLTIADSIGGGKIYASSMSFDIIAAQCVTINNGIFDGYLSLRNGSLIINGGTFNNGSEGGYSISDDDGTTVVIYGGEFPNGFYLPRTDFLNDFIAEGCYFRDADGKIITVADNISVIKGYVKVSKGADLADAVITLDETQFTYSGMEHKPTVIVTVGGKTLTEGKDYTLTFANNVNAGTATVTIKAIGQAAGGIAGGGENIGNSSNSGDITESVYTGEVTKEFTIAKKPVTVTATAPDKAYDGTSDIDVSEIVITFDGIVDGDTVGYTIKEAWFNGIVVGTDWPVPIVYNVTGEDANNYTFPAGGEYIAPDYFVEATADITAKDIFDGSIILGEALTYNGKEQTQTVEKVLTTNNLEATYTVSGNKATNVGVYLLTVTGTGNFTGEAKIAYEIAPDVECISHLDRVEDNGVMKWNVKSTDRESLKYVIDQLNNAVTDIADDDTKNEWADTKEACEDMLRIINSIELAIADVEEDYAGFSEDTVKSSDIPALDELVSKVNEIKDRYGFNLTDEEAKKLEDILDGIEKLKAKIAETAEEIERIDEAVNGYDEETVTSDDIPELVKLIEDIKALTDGDNLTDDERAALEANDEAIDELVEKFAEVAEEIKKVDEAVKSYSEETVKSTDKEDLAQLKEDIQTLIDSTNTTENEKTALEEMIKDIEGLEDKITETEEKLEEIKDIENNFNPETVSSEDKAAIEDKIAEIEAVNPDNLTDEQREEYEEIKAGFEALLEEIAAAEKAVADIGTQLEMFDKERVTKFWEDDIEALKAKIDELLADENMGEAEKAKLNEYKAQCDKLIEIINTPVEYFSLRFFYLIWDCLMWKYNGILGLFTK